MLTEGYILNHRYQVLRVLSDKGGMGVIYQATDRNFNNTVVIKHSRFTEQFLKQQYPGMPSEQLRSQAEFLRKAFEREARLVRGLKHHALPSVIDYFTNGDGHQFFVMDFIPGKDLGEMLDERLQQSHEPFPLDQVLDWADQLLDTLDYLHTRFESPIIHRDLKPLNLKLTPDGRIVLLDFGLAKGATPGMSVVSASIHGYTMQYAPLEQIRGKGTSVRSDLYSLAVTLHHLLTGTVPPSAVDRVTETTSGEADPLRPLHEINPQIPVIVSAVLQRAASINQNERYATAAEMREAVRRASEPKPVLSTVKPPVQAAEPTIIDTPPSAEKSELLGNILDQSAPVDVSSATLERHSPSPQEVERQPKPVSPPSVVNPNSPPAYSPKLPAKSVASVQSSPLVTPPASVRRKSNQSFRRNVSIAALCLVIVIIIIIGIYNWKSPGPTWQLKQTLTGHSSVINSVAFSPDGKTLASGSGDNTVKLWDVQTGALKQTLTGHSDLVGSVAFVLDGKMLASGSADNTIRLWDIQTGTAVLKKTLNGHCRGCKDAVSLDGKMLASASDDNVVKVWNVQTGALKRTLAAHSDTVFSIAFSPDGKTLASGSGDKTIKLWDMQTGALKQTLTGHSNWVYYVAFSPDGKTLASGGYDRTVMLWDAQTGALKDTIAGGDSPMAIEFVVFSPDGKTLANGEVLGRTLRLYDAQTRVLKQTLTGYSSGINSVTFSPDGKILAFGLNDNNIELWKVTP